MAKTFQEQLDELISAYVPADKLTEVKEKFAPISSAMTNTFQHYAEDIETAKARLRTLEGIKPEEFARLDTLVKQQADRLMELETSATDYKTKYETSENALRDTKCKLMATTRENAIRKALVDAKLPIAADSLDEVYGSIDRKVVQKPDGSFVVPSVLISKDSANNEIRTPVEHQITDYLTKEWAVTPFAKRVILADDTTGGGANGSGRGGRGSKPFSEMSFAEKTVMARDNPVMYKQLSTKE
jgi:hypothetical protein